MIFKQETLLLLSLVGSMTLLPNQAHAQDEEHYHGIRSLNKDKGMEKAAARGNNGKAIGKNKRMPCDEIPDDMVDAFMSDMMMKSDSTAEMMGTMEDVSDGTFFDNMYSMDDMDPIDLLTDDATINVDGKELNPKRYPPATVFGSNLDNGMSMLVTTTLEGGLETVFMIDPEGTTTARMQAISPGCMVSITPEMMDEEKLSEFKEGEAVDMSDGDNILRKLETSPLDPATARQLEEFAPCDATLRVIEVAFGVDSSFCSKAGGRSKAIAKIGQMVALANEKYKVPGICARIRIKFCDIQCAASTDHYSTPSAVASRGAGCSGQSDFLQFVRNLWKDNEYLKARRGDATHVFTGTDFSPANANGDKTIGCAYNGSLCDDYSFGVTHVFYNPDLALQTKTFAHELGHNAGSGHREKTLDTFFIMAQGAHDGSSGFHPVSRGQIDTYINSVGCV